MNASSVVKNQAATRARAGSVAVISRISSSLERTIRAGGNQSGIGSCNKALLTFVWVTVEGIAQADDGLKGKVATLLA